MPHPATEAVRTPGSFYLVVRKHFLRFRWVASFSLGLRCVVCGRALLLGCSVLAFIRKEGSCPKKQWELRSYIGGSVSPISVVTRLLLVGQAFHWFRALSHSVVGIFRGASGGHCVFLCPPHHFALLVLSGLPFMLGQRVRDILLQIIKPSRRSGRMYNEGGARNKRYFRHQLKRSYLADPTPPVVKWSQPLPPIP